MSQWLPIETAPMDGTKVDLWVVFPTTGGVRWPNAFFDTEERQWAGPSGFNAGQYTERPAIKHWMPLPEPPTPDGRR